MDLYRHLQPAPQPLHHAPQHLALETQNVLDLTGLDHNVFQQDLHLQDPSAHAFAPPPGSYNNEHQPLHAQDTECSTMHPAQQNHGDGGQFDVVASSSLQHNSVGRLQQEEDFFGTSEGADQRSNGHLSSKIVVDPPNLEEWRARLFNVDGMITLSEEEFETYFRHIDNVYSHRSTQRYKRKPFVSHYWDCRLKGRPPGTPKSDNPNKKKRKRTARERDLCDVKIKITEYFPGAMLRADFMQDGGAPIQDPDSARTNNFFAPGQPGGPLLNQQQYGMAILSANIVPSHPGARGQRYYTIQRVNGNGGNGKSDGVAGPHKHSLAESDRVKKNSVQRFVMKKNKHEKKSQAHSKQDKCHADQSEQQKTYHKKASGSALATARKHSRDHELKLFGSCFCPFVQRIWIALEAKAIQYQYIEVDPYKKPQALLEVNPRGLVPAIRHGDWTCGESTVIMEYLEDLGVGNYLLPQGNTQDRADCRFWSDHINRNIIPTFYQLLQAQGFPKQVESTKKLQDHIATLVNAADPQGPFFLGSTLSWVDIQFAPWMIRCRKVLKHYRSWPDPPEGSRWGHWIEAVEGNESVRATTSNDDLYLDSYERYAQNRPGTSMLADAVNGGYGLP